MFNVGDEVYLISDSEIHWLQILTVGTDYLVKDYWETQSLEEERQIRAWVKRITLQEANAYLFHQNVELNIRDFEELDRFNEIETGLNKRKQRTAEMQGLVQDSIAKQHFETALNLLTEWALLEKYKPEIYLLREECLRKLGRDLEANYELHVYKTLTGK